MLSSGSDGVNLSLSEESPRSHLKDVNKTVWYSDSL